MSLLNGLSELLHGVLVAVVLIESVTKFTSLAKNEHATLIESIGRLLREY
jgi:hypothetical protein